VRARRLAHTVVNAVAPGVGGRWATDVFSRTRAPRARPDKVLPLGARSFPIDDRCVDSGYLWGDGGPVALLVHGWGANSSSMQPLVPTLRGLGFTVAAFDAPGHGVSTGTRVTVKDFADTVGEVLRTLGDVRVIVAHSLGSLAVAGALTTVDAPVRCMVLLAPASTLAGVIERWTPTEITLTRSTVDKVYRELHRRSGVPVEHWDFPELGAGIGRPILAMHDPADRVVPFSDAKEIAAAVPDVRLVPVPERGHTGILMAPEVKSAISAFVAEHTGQTEGVGS